MYSADFVIQSRVKAVRVRDAVAKMRALTNCLYNICFLYFFKKTKLVLMSVAALLVDIPVTVAPSTYIFPAPCKLMTQKDWGLGAVALPGTPHPSLIVAPSSYYTNNSCSCSVADICCVRLQLYIPCARTVIDEK